MAVPADNDNSFTLRIPRLWVALLLAALGHLLVGYALSLIVPPPPPPQRVAITVRPPPQQPPPPSVPPPSSSPEPQRKPSKRSPRPQTSPVAPVLPASDKPPDNRAQLPAVEVDPTPAPPPTWQAMLQDALAESTPRTTTTLGPSASTLARIANADPRLHDEDNERRLQTDFGPFFRRGIEALRSRWHPDEVLVDRQDPQTRRCAQQTRTTRAVAIINRNGDVVDVELMSSSGCPTLDDEAVSAFRKVAQFPNPPEGLFVDGDGAPTKTARYPVRFIVTFDGRIRLDWQ